MTFVTPCAYPHLSDRQAIQTAVDTAVQTDIRTVVIPGTKSWNLDGPVLLPNCVTVILDGAQIRAKGVAFANTAYDSEETLCLGAEQHRLHLLGTNGAVIIGQADPQIVLRNVRDFTIRGIGFENGGGIRLLHARYGSLQQLRFHGSLYGVFLGEGCSRNLISDILARTEREAVLWQGGSTAVWGRDADMYESILCRVDAKTQGAPAVALYAAATGTRTMFLRDITDRTEGDGHAVQLGGVTDSVEILDLSVRGVASGRSSVAVGDICDGVYLANLQSPPRIDPKATRVMVDEETEAIEAVHPAGAGPVNFVNANELRFRGADDAETLQNALDFAAGSCVVIPRWNDRTGSTLWNVGRTLRVPSDTTVILLDAHLRLEDFTYCNLFTNKDRPGRNIRILGIGSATADSGSFNGLMAGNAGTMGFGPITDNALMLFAGVDGLTVEHLHMKQQRWACVLCVGCTNGRLADLDFHAPRVHPDLGGIRLHSGCRNMLVERITGLTGDDVVALRAVPEDDALCSCGSGNITAIHIRDIKADTCRCSMVDLRTRGGGKISDVLIETMVDCSLAEQKRVPNACVQVGDAFSENVTDIRLRDMAARAVATVRFGGKSEGIRICNLHSFGSSGHAICTDMVPEHTDYVLSGPVGELADKTWGPRAVVRNWHINGLFFRCQQASHYMRGTATSIITNKKNYLGTVLYLRNLVSENFRVENILAYRIGEGMFLSGRANVEVTGFCADEVGRTAATCGKNCRLTLNGETIHGEGSTL